MANRNSQVLNIKPFYTVESENPYSLFNWKTVDCEIKDSNGNVFFEQRQVEAPEDWSQHAVEIAASKYFRKSGVSKAGGETSIRQLVSRVVDAITGSGIKQQYFAKKKDATIFANELTHILLSQRALFNSPVWFNCGLYETYHIESEGQLYAWDPKLQRVTKTEGVYRHPQASACFIQKIDDSLDGIFELLKNEAKIFKYGSGSGTNFSSLRSRYEPLANGGTSSGLLSFLEVFDRAAAAVKSGGTTRRAAKMVCLDVDHPEIEEFVNWKLHEESKAKALLSAGFDGDSQQEAYRTVSGQNSNNSIRLSDAFLKAVRENKDWGLKARDRKTIVKKVSAKKLWNDIVKAAWTCADPGVQFHQTIQKWHTCTKSGEIRASNPCSEFMFLDDTACNLASLNLTKFLGENGEFDFAGFIHTARVIFIAQEILIDYSGYPTETIAQNSHDFRPLGIGIAGLGAAFMRMGLAYDSDDARSWAGALAALLTGVAYRTSTEIAEILAPFPQYATNKLPMLKVIRKHQFDLMSLLYGEIPDGLFNLVNGIWKEVLLRGQEFGFRNSQTTVMAPTGTIGIVMDSETTGVEPEFALIKTKKLSGGGELKMASQSLLIGLRRLNYSPEQIEKISNYVQEKGTISGAPQVKSEHFSVFHCAREISPEAHLKIMVSIQPFISGAISKTINLPTDATVQEVENIYWQAWELGLKSVTVYRDGCKHEQPLQGLTSKTDQDPKCTECGSPTELAGGCFRCINCGTTIGCS